MRGNGLAVEGCPWRAYRWARGDVVRNLQRRADAFIGPPTIWEVIETWSTRKPSDSYDTHYYTDRGRLLQGEVEIYSFFRQSARGEIDNRFSI